MDFITSIILYPASWFMNIILNSKTAVIFVSAFTTVMFFRYVIFPLVGSKTNTFSQISKTMKETKKEDK